jgi:hypothetical protein
VDLLILSFGRVEDDKDVIPVRTVTLLSAVFLLGCCDRIERFVMDVFIREKITVTFVEYFIRLWFLVILYLLFTKFYLKYYLLLEN